MGNAHTKMDYNLALKLKNAGFPQEGKDGDWYYNVNGKLDFEIAYNFDKWKIKCPTLSELIEACGDIFFKLVEVKKPPYPVWGATGGNYKMTDKTPEEAVANLWLKLHEKK